MAAVIEQHTPSVFKQGLPVVAAGKTFPEQFDQKDFTEFSRPDKFLEEKIVTGNARGLIYGKDAPVFLRCVFHPEELCQIQRCGLVAENMASVFQRGNRLFGMKTGRGGNYRQIKITLPQCFIQSAEAGDTEGIFALVQTGLHRVHRGLYRKAGMGQQSRQMGTPSYPAQSNQHGMNNRICIRFHDPVPS